MRASHVGAITRADETGTSNGRRLTLVRNATVLLELGRRRLLVDPMLDDAGARPPLESSDNERRNPLVPLPLPVEEVVNEVDAVLATHLHRDHFDAAAVRYLPRDVPVFCQPEDQQRLRLYGFDARPVHGTVTHGGLQITRTGGQHGSGEIARDQNARSELHPQRKRGALSLAR